MRIIAGQFRSRPLKSLKNLKIRPTSDMLRETLFNVLGPRVEGARFLDLFAGTGAVGIEAISRGAAHVVLVENHRPTAKLITDNLALLEITAGARVIVSDALVAISKLESAKLEPGSAAPFDFVFLDPPYANQPDYHAVLQALEKSTLLSESSIVIAEHRKTFALPTAIGRLEQFRTLKQGDAALTFYRSAYGRSLLTPKSPKNSTQLPRIFYHLLSIRRECPRLAALVLAGRIPGLPSYN